MESASNLEVKVISLPNSKENVNFFAKILKSKIGVIPLPLYLVLSAIIYSASVYNFIQPKRPK